MKGVSLFSSAGVAETYFQEIDINIIVANELIKERAKLYSSVYQESNMIVGNILDDNIYKNILSSSGKRLIF